MGIRDMIPIILAAAHFVFVWIYIGIVMFPGGAIVSVGFGLYVIVALNVQSVLFYLRATQTETNNLITISFFAMAFSNCLFLIIVAVWSGVR
jgi:hypothetical protein